MESCEKGRTQLTLHSLGYIKTLSMGFSFHLTIKYLLEIIVCVTLLVIYGLILIKHTITMNKYY